MSFAIGQKVVCIREEWPPYPFGAADMPRKNALYHVRAILPARDPDRPCCYLWLAEIRNPRPAADISEPWFAAICFRPVVERPTDIGVFHKLLTPAPARRPETVA